MILVTGTTGFVGGALQRHLAANGWPVIGAVRKSAVNGEIPIGDIGEFTNWRQALEQVECVIHCAARVHIMREKSGDPLASFRMVNVAGTLNLAEQAAAHGVRRFIYLSSLKVNGEATYSDVGFKADDLASPSDPYSLSKFEAEEGLRKLAARTDMELVIVRPPLVYGPGVKANFETMIRYVSWGVPLPLGAIKENRRSLVGIDNLIDLLVRCIDHPNAAGQTFLVSDGEDLSTFDLLTRLGIALGKPARLWPVPSCVLKIGAMLLGRHGFAQRLLGSLQVDITKTRDVLSWAPPYGVDECLRRSVNGLPR